MVGAFGRHCARPGRTAGRNPSGGPSPVSAEPSAGEREGLAPRMDGGREGLAPRMDGEREGLAPRMDGEREGLAPRMEEPARAMNGEARSRWGFTLLELMVALAVLAIVCDGRVRARRRLRARPSFHGAAHAGPLGRGKRSGPDAPRTSRQQAGDQPGHDAPAGCVKATARGRWSGRPNRHPTPALRRVEVTVYAVEDGREVGPLDTLVAFMGRY